MKKKKRVKKNSSASSQNGKTEVLRGPQPSHNPRPNGLSNGISSVKKRGSFFRLAQFSWYAGGPWKRSSRRQYLQSTVQLNGKSLIQNDNCHSAHSPLSRDKLSVGDRSMIFPLQSLEEI